MVSLGFADSWIFWEGGWPHGKEVLLGELSSGAYVGLEGSGACDSSQGKRMSSFFFPVKEKPSSPGSGGVLLFIRAAQRKQKRTSLGTATSLFQPTSHLPASDWHVDPSSHSSIQSPILIHLPKRPSTHLSTQLSIPSIYLSNHTFFLPSIQPSIHLFFRSLSYTASPPSHTSG